MIKTINGDKLPDDLDRLTRAAAGRPDVTLDDGFVEPERVTALIAGADCYVSLHRSEGFGLTIAEAMALGKPAIATGYSGNLAFMNEENSYLVPYRLTTIPEGVGPYPAGALWAEPDLDAAARLMRRAFENPEEARARGRLARETILDRLSVERAARFLSTRLPEIERLRLEREKEFTPARRAQSFLASGPETRWEAPSRFGGIGRAYRRLLLRLLRPYTVRQREFELAVAAGLEQAEAAARQTRDRLRRADEALRRVETLEAEVRSQRDQLERLRGRSR